jgi:cytochrome P450
VHGVRDFEFPSAEMTSCPYPVYDMLREGAPVYKYPERNEYLVTRWEDIVYIARHPERFSHQINQADPSLGRVRTPQSYTQVADSTRYTPYGMASSDPPEHKTKRALGLRMLTKDRLRGYEQMIRAHTNELIDGWIERGECEFRSEFADVLPARVIADALGFPLEDVPKFLRFGRNESQGARYFDEERVAREAALFAEAAAYCRAALQDRHEHPRDDLVSELIAAQTEQDGVFDIDYLTAETLTLLLAGNVTTAHMFASAMTILCTEPGIQAEVRADPSLATTLCDETIRIESPLQWHLRVCREDTELGGVLIPAGAFVVVFYGSGNRDEARFDNPAAFDLHRPNLVKHHLAFGHGAHHCLGAPLARMEGQIAFEILLERLHDLRIDEAKSDLEPIDSTRFRAPRRIVLSFDPVPAAVGA